MRKLKFLVFAMAFTLLITCIPLDVFAQREDPNYDIQKIKSLFEIGDEYDDFNKRQYDNYNGKKITYLSWNNQNVYINVEIDEDGDIVGYQKNIYSGNRNMEIYKFPKISREEGEEVAKAFIKKLYPNILNKIKSDDEYAEYSRNSLRDYSYSFTRVENDILFKENSVYINVDTQTGEVNSFHINWEKDLKFVDTNNIISKDEAKEIYKDNVNLKLSYKVRETDKGLKSYLGYNIIDTEKSIDAKTKDILNTSHKSTYNVYGSMSYRDMEKISLEEENKLINSKKILGRKEAGEKILNTFKLGKEYTVEDHRLVGSSEKDIYIWEVMVTKQVGNHGSGTSARIDAKTGEIIDFSDPGLSNREVKKAKYSREELFNKANELVKNSSPEKYKEVQYVETEKEDLVFRNNNASNFLFIREVNDIKVENDGFRIVLSNITGDVLSYDYNWSYLEFESPKDIIPKDSAKKILFDNRELALEYQRENDKKEEKDVKLVYDFKDKYLTVDAKDGKVVDNIRDTRERPGLVKYQDIKNNSTKEQINRLQNYIFLFKGEKFNPEQEITQGEFFQLLTQVSRMYYLYNDQVYMYERLIDEGILKREEKNIEGKITREEAIKYVIRAFGQEPLEDLGDIYKLDYKDKDEISPNLRGHIAIAKGLGILNKEENFRPKDNLTREESVILIYNILNR